MTIRLPLSSALTLALTCLPAFADETANAPLATVNVGSGPHLVVTCSEASLPSLREIAAVLDTNNAGQIYGEREHLMATARRECARGFREIVFVRDQLASTPALAMADLSTRPGN